MQPNYGLLSSSANVHRGIGQRLTAELLNRLGVHILSERPIKVGAARQATGEDCKGGD